MIHAAAPTCSLAAPHHTCCPWLTPATRPLPLQAAASSAAAGSVVSWLAARMEAMRNVRLWSPYPLEAWATGLAQLLSRENRLQVGSFAASACCFAGPMIPGLAECPRGGGKCAQMCTFWQWRGEAPALGDATNATCALPHASLPACLPACLPAELQLCVHRRQRLPPAGRAAGVRTQLRQLAWSTGCLPHCSCSLLGLHAAHACHRRPVLTAAVAVAVASGAPVCAG